MDLMFFLKYLTVIHGIRIPMNYKDTFSVMLYNYWETNNKYLIEEHL